MSESIWEELTRSPLEPDPEYESTFVDWLVPLVIAATLGFAIGFAVLGSDDGAPATTTIAAATSTTEAPELPDPDPIVPEGYIDVGGVGLQAVAAYGRDGSLYVVVNQASRSDRVPVDTAAFHASHWVLEGVGNVQAHRVIESTLAPGTRTIEFRDVPALPVAGAQLLVREGSEMVVRTGCQGCGAIAADRAEGELILEGLERPYSLDSPLLIDVAPGLTLSIDSLDFTNEWGYVTWHVIDENQARIRVEIRLIFDGTDDPDRDGTNPTQLIPNHLFGTNQQNPAPANPQSFMRSGDLQLERIGELISEENQPGALIMSWSVEWQHPVSEPVELQLSDDIYLGIVD
ncbi:MAG: hypothetical protein QNJ75_04105 [Acidimicrobiia bacterium]|nr:hypothetical protein [Acidimicrobiia bacterium]